MTTRPGVSRRAVLAASALLPLAGCAPVASVEESRPPSTTSAPDVRPQLEDLEHRFDARIGVFAFAIGSGTAVEHRADDRFAFCSTFKALAAAAVLHRNPLEHLSTRVGFTRADVNSISPVTEHYVDTGMTIGELCDAAIRYSDGTAGNLLLADIGGPAGFTTYLRGLGDEVSRLDQGEPGLNDDPPGDPRDTTTPRAIAADYRKLVFGAGLDPTKRAILTDWLIRNTTGAARIRSAVPTGWMIGNKTGTGNYGRANDIAVLWPPRSAPMVLAIMSDRGGGHDAEPSDELIALTARRVLAALV